MKKRANSIFIYRKILDSLEFNEKRANSIIIYDENKKITAKK